jgi:surface carbohydrate biosynthesis protein
MKKIKPRIYLPIETKRREFNARIFFASKAIQKNWSVVICSKQDLFSKYKLMQPGVIFLKSLQESYHEIMEKLKKNKFTFVATNEEGLLFIHPNFILNKVNEKCLNDIDYFFCWGEVERSILIKKLKVDKSKLILSGNARIDILKEKNRNLLIDESIQIQKKYGKFILFTTKFGRANFIPRFGIKSWLEGQFLNGNVNKDDKEYLNIVKKSVYHEENNLRLFLQFLEKFNYNFPDRKLIIRPHPSENHETYKLHTNKYKNIIVINDDKSTNSWILASDFLVHSNCTTSIEAHILNKSSINFLGSSDKDVEHTLPKIFSSNVYSVEELLDEIKKRDTNQETIFFKSKNDEAKDWIFNIDNNTSSNTILEALEKFNTPIDKKGDKNSNFVFYLYYKLKRFLRNTIYNHINKNDSGYNQLIKQKMTIFKKKEIKNICKSYIDDKKFERVKLKEIYPDIFEINYD